MRIGILTFHLADNYGAVLQSYALQTYLRKQWHKVEVIDYRQPHLAKNWALITKDRLLGKRWQGTVIRLITEFGWKFWFRWARKKGFNHFRNHVLSMSRPVFSWKQIPHYDVYIIGSDQIWNYQLTGGLDKAYLGLFDKGQSKIIYYAASTFPFKIDDAAKTSFRKTFNNADAISVREEVLVDIYQPLTEKPINVVVDPTLLLGADEYDDIVVSPKKRNYVLVYEVREHPDTIKFAERIAKQLDCHVEYLTSGLHTKFTKNVHQSATPEQFLGYIKNAKCVITTSFHAVTFSIKFKVPFYVFMFGDMNDSRSHNICKIYGLESRCISNASSVSFSPIIYKETDGNEIAESKKFLKYNLE